mmetsp:Transcript_46316/g.34026  ORF Transcript_46316/g.34026 Transcript_46316/m.34026 type:complete len:202 (-) Transcript_46316:149-754(-)
MHCKYHFVTLQLLIFRESISDFLGHVFEVSKNSTIKSLSICKFSFIDQFFADLPHSCLILQPSIERIRICIYRISLNIVDAEFDEDELSNGCLFLFRLLSKVLRGVEVPRMILFAELQPSNFAFAHGAEGALVVVVVERIAHLELRYRLPLLVEVDQTPVVVTSLMPVIDGVLLFYWHTTSLLEHVLYYSFWLFTQLLYPN